MKRILIIFSAVILLLGGIVGYILSYPQSMINGPTSEIIYDDGYFITKFALDNIQLLKDNDFTLTEEELTGYLNYQLVNNNFSLDSTAFKAHYMAVDLMEDAMVLNVYGKLLGLPVRIQSYLKPNFNNQRIDFTVSSLKFSRVTIPERYFSRFIGDLGKSPALQENSHFSIPVDFHEMVMINDIKFEKDEVVIQYQLNRDKLLEELLKEFRGRIGL